MARRRTGHDLKAIRDLIAAIEAAGGVIHRTSNGHLRVTGPSGIAVVGGDFGDWRARRNVARDLRRHAGIDLKRVR